MTVGKYLDILKRGERDISDQSDKSPSAGDRGPDFGRFSRFRREPQRFCRAAFDALERRCPDYVDPERWQQAVADGRRFLIQWGDKATGLGWTARELFGLHAVPASPALNYSRLSRYDETGLIWLLHGRPVVALTDATATIQGASGRLVYRKHNKPALGPLGDSFDDMGSVTWAAAGLAIRAPAPSALSCIT
jgi:hypothetical protein